MTSSQDTRTHIVIPIVRTNETCGAFDPDDDYRCRRPAGHGGRHAFFWVHVQPGRVRKVWR